MRKLPIAMLSTTKLNQKDGFILGANRRKGKGWRVQLSLDIGGLYIPLGGLSLPLHLEVVATFGSHYFP
jgi:hypothetical protein